MKAIAYIIFLVQAIAAVRSYGRMARTATGSRISRVDIAPPRRDVVTVLVPVLNEAKRITPCLEGLSSQGLEVAEVIVIDGGSADGTPDLVREWAGKDARVRLVDSAPVPDGINGKAYNLQFGLQQAAGTSGWLLTIDADVRPVRNLVQSLLAHAAKEKVDAFSVATQQMISGAAEGLIHPSMLATLVYRFGIPGTAPINPDDIQANGQCFFVRRSVLDEVGGFSGVQHDVSEDVTLARLIARAGHEVGFYESEGLVGVEMYSSLRDAWINWTRSLPMQDRFTRRSSAARLAEATLVQALPIWLAPYFARSLGRSHPATMLNLGLVMGRVGVLAGMARAYRSLPWTYWISPLVDIAVVARIWQMRGRRVHTWRGRHLVPGDMS